ncbi:MAG: DNA polymerase III subunit beta [Omnitrophica bacterium GWA2_41_15]|nr:MAG: DNA polymerase III subunit beta [Omnitrophica bacterium GWA2_41_15]
MNIKFIKKELIEGLALIQKFCAKQSHLVTLQGVCLKAEENGLTLLATNLELGAEIYLAGQVSDYKELRVIVDGKILLEALKYFNGDVIEINFNEQKLTAKSAEQELELALSGAEDFPDLPKDSGEEIKISLNNLKNGLDKTSFCVNRSNLRPELAGVYFEVEGNDLYLAASDSFRLAQQIVKLEEIISKKLTGLLPVRLAQEIQNLSLVVEKELKIFLTEHQIGLVWSGGRIISRLLEGQFPAYKNILPNKFNLTVTAPKIELLQAVQGAAAIATGPLQEVKLKINPSGGLINLDSHYQQSNHKATIHCSGEGEEITVSLNIKYLSEGLARIPEEQITINGNSALQPILITGGEENKNNFYLLMPLQS